MNKRQNYEFMPFTTGLNMEEQNLAKFDKKISLPASKRTILARCLLIGGTLIFTGIGNIFLYTLLGKSLDIVLFKIFYLLFTLSLLWISFSAANAFVGIIFKHIKDSWQEDELGTSKTAIVMPLYNENTEDSLSSLEAMAMDLQKKKCAKNFEIVILSDTNNLDIIQNEKRQFRLLREQLANVMPVWYRNRAFNTGKKAGNIAEFIKKWGGGYDYMLVLDADSLMSAETIQTMVKRMQGDSKLGILQTVPVLCGELNFFSRLQQFAGRVYGKVNAAGIAAWAGNEGNYWGHNALIRIKSFAESCGLPVLKGKKPFGGSILSHDFVEAALIRRNGWKVRIAPELTGSWEGTPPSLLEQTKRDRRWTQGNLQHLKVIGAKGLSFWNRLHFAVGIMGYVSSVLWLLLIAVGTLILVKNNVEANSVNISSMNLLSVYTMTVLFIPKIFGWFSSIASKETCSLCGGKKGITLSMLIEIIASCLFAPITMLFNTKNILEIVFGMDSGWNAQCRSMDRLFFTEALRAHWWQCLAGLIASMCLMVYYPENILCYLPVIAGLTLAIPLSVLSSSKKAGIIFYITGLLLIAEETHEPALMKNRNNYKEKLALAAEVAA